MDGKHGVSALPANPLFSGVDLGCAVVIPPGGQVFYVRGDGTNVTSYEYDPPGLNARLIASVAKALTYCTASAGDTIVVLPGHTENIAAANSWPLVVGVRIIGLGNGTRRPTFTWTVAASTVLMNKAGVTIDNCILNLDPGTGTVTVTAPITVSAAGCRISRCQIRTSTDSSNLATVGITTTAAADDLEIIGNEVYGAAGTVASQTFKFVGADRLKFIGNTVIAGAPAATSGNMLFATTACTNIVVSNNKILNTHTASSVVVLGTTGETGVVGDTLMGSLATASAILTGTAWTNGTASGLVFDSDVTCANGAGKSATKFGVAAS